MREPLPVSPLCPHVSWVLPSQTTVRLTINELLKGEYLACGDATSYLGMVLEEPIIAESAFKHGLTKDDILHAYRNPIRIWDLGDGFTMMIGANAAAIILEVG
ncbi:MAG: hypothetical protein RLZ94_1078 [Actinomycetota bacterium]